MKITVAITRHEVCVYDLDVDEVDKHAQDDADDIKSVALLAIASGEYEPISSNIRHEDVDVLHIEP